MAVTVHPLALVEPGAELGDGVRVGPFCHVGAKARLDAGVELKSHVTIMGETLLGAGSVVWPNAVLGGDPQNKAHKGGPSRLVIGANCIIREACTFSLGTDTARGETTIGANGYFMGGVHIAHDCVIGDNVTFANSVLLAGHVEIGDYVTVGGSTAIHQFVRVGRRAFVAGATALTGDVIPFGLASGNHAKLRGLNVVGLKRSGMERSDIRALMRAYRQLFDRSRPLNDNIAEVEADFADNPAALEMVAFFRDRAKRQYCLPPLRGGASGEDDDGE